MMRYLPLALAVSGVVLVLAAVAGWRAAGGAGALGAAAGVFLVVLSYLVSSLVIAWADSVDPRLVLPVGLATYVIKFALLGLVLLAVVGTGWAGTLPMGVAIVPGVLAWTGATMWWALRQPGTAHPRTVGVVPRASRPSAGLRLILSRRHGR